MLPHSFDVRRRALNVRIVAVCVQVLSGGRGGHQACCVLRGVGGVACAPLGGRVRGAQPCGAPLGGRVWGAQLCSAPLGFAVIGSGCYGSYVLRLVSFFGN